MSDNIQLARKDIDNICCIYRSVGEAMYDEPRDRLACRFAKRLDEKDTELSTMRGLLREALERDPNVYWLSRDWHSRVTTALDGKPSQMQATYGLRIHELEQKLNTFQETSEEVIQLRKQLAAAEAERDRIRRQRDDAEKERHNALERLAAAEAAMKAVASLPGKDWLIGQLALAEALNGKGGQHLQYALIQNEKHEEAKGGRDGME